MYETTDNFIGLSNETCDGKMQLELGSCGYQEQFSYPL